MFTRNYYYYLAQGNGIPEQFVPAYFNNVTNATVSLRTKQSTGSLRPYLGTIATSYSYSGIIFGDGTSEPTLDDCRLSGNIITTVASTYIDIDVDIMDDGIRAITTHTIRNTGSNNITIREMGIIGYMTGGAGGSYYVLLEHSLLETPITISPNATANISYTIFHPYSTGGFTRAYDLLCGCGDVGSSSRNESLTSKILSVNGKAYYSINPTWGDYWYGTCKYETLLTVYPSEGTMRQGIILGNGTAEATPYDYKLSGDVITSAEITSMFALYEDIGDGIKTTKSYIVKNTGSENITISEVGIIGTTYSNSGWINLLIYRSLLETPVTVVPGESAQIDLVTYQPCN